jgi:hypothetical protein
VPLLIVHDLGMRKLPQTAAEVLLELVMRRYERASTLLTSNRPVDDWGKLLGDTAAVTALLDRPYTTRTSTSAGPGTGAPRSTPTCVRRSLRSKTLAVSAAAKWPALTRPEMAGLEMSAEGKIQQR